MYLCPNSKAHLLACGQCILRLSTRILFDLSEGYMFCSRSHHIPDFLIEVMAKGGASSGSEMN